MLLKRLQAACLIAVLFGALTCAFSTPRPAFAAPPDPPQVVAGNSLVCLLNSAGQLECFGNPQFGINNVPALPEGITYRQVSLDIFVGCALRSDGSIICWGDNSFNHFAAPALPAGLTYTAVDTGEFTACALRSDGSAICWGYDGAPSMRAVPALPAGLTYTVVESGGQANCALRSDGRVFCWGESSYVNNVPALPEGTTYTQLSVGYETACAIRSDQAMVCWGNNFYSQLNVPALPSGITYTQVSVGMSASCALRSDDQPVCWGYYPPPTYQSPVPGHPDGITIETISILQAFACIRYSDDTVACWGDNDNNQTIRLNLTPASLPAPQYGVAYSQTLSTSGGAEPYSYSLYSGSLPAGLALSVNGALTGTPTVRGEFNFIVQVKDSHAVPFTTWKSYSLAIRAVPTSQDASRTILEDNQVSFSAEDFPYSSEDPSASLQSVMITSLPGVGTLYLDANSNNLPDTGEAVSAAQSVIKADLGKLKYQPVADGNGPDYASFTFAVTDQWHSSSECTMRISVTPVNDAPVMTLLNVGSPRVRTGSAAFSAAFASDLLAGPPDESGQTLSFELTNDATELFSAGPVIEITGSSATLRFTPASMPDLLTHVAHITAMLKDSAGGESQMVEFTITIEPWMAYLLGISR